MHHICKGAHKQTHNCIKGDKYETRKQTELGVGQPKIGYDEICETRQQLSVNKIHNIQNGQKTKKNVVPGFNTFVT